MSVDQALPAINLQAALAAVEDPLAKARDLLPLHRSWAENANIPRDVRPVVARSWARAGALSKDIRPMDAAAVRERREANTELSELLPLFKDRLLSLAVQAGNQLVVSDAQGYVLWVLGPSTVRRHSDGIGFVTGARWREADVGTNGIGAAMAERAPVQIFGPEHAREEQHAWVCTSAPVLHPASAAIVGTITLAGSYRTAHPHSLALVSSVAGEAAGMLRLNHERAMFRLEASTSLPDGDYLLVDRQGLVASVRGYDVAGRIQLPRQLAEGEQWFAGLGELRATPVPGGWLLQPATQHTVLELSALPDPHVVVRSPGGATRVALSCRHWQLLQLLAAHPQGVDLKTLATLWPRDTPAVTVRAEISRLRARLRGHIASRPYRLLAPVVHTG